MGTDPLLGSEFLFVRIFDFKNIFLKKYNFHVFWLFIFEISKE